MSLKIYKEYFILVVLLISIVFPVVSQEFGLQFNGQNKTLDERTGLDVSPNDYLKFEDEFEISFQIKSREYFGYVLRIINKNNKNVDLLSQYGDSRDLNIVVGDINTIIPIDSKVPKSLWSLVVVKIDLISRRVILTIDSKTFYINHVNFQRSDAFKLFFGSVEFNEFTSMDVPKMAIRNLKIKTKGQLVLNFPLNEVSGNFAKDLIQGKQLTVTNPVWIKPLHSYWKEVVNGKAKGVILDAIDQEKGMLYLLSNEKIMIVNLKNNRIQEVPIKNRLTDLTNDNKIVFNVNDGLVYCYSRDDKSVNKLNPKSGMWLDSTFVTSVYQKYQNHNKYLSKKENSIYMFGGYGQHKYSNEVHKLDINTGVWTDLKSDNSIYTPRYLSAIGALNDTLYLLGGYGSVYGDQMINPKSNYDLIGYSLKENKFFKKFEISQVSEGMVFGNKMWIDSLNRAYYTLMFDKHLYNGELQLLKGDLDSNLIEKMGSSIPFKFRDTKSNETLYYLPSERKLIGYTSFLRDSIHSNFSISSINYPPNTPPKDLAVQRLFPLRSVILFLIVFIAFIIFYKNRRVKNKFVKLSVEKDPNNVLSKESLEKTSTKTLLSPDQALSKPVYNFIFFGGFQIFNKDSKDITNKFSPLLKELFLLIWLYTHKNNKGISSEKITDVLWPDKSTKSAQNNRAVNIAKIRQLLNEVGGYTLNKDTGYWKISHNESLPKSDYYDLLRITSSKKEAISKEKIDYLIEITNKGKFLLNVRYEWLDSFNADVSDLVIDTLISYAESVDIKADPEFLIKLSDCVFNFDSINEEAMVFKCKAQYILGKHSLAKSTYAKFVKEYELLYDQKFELSFTETVNKTN